MTKTVKECLMEKGVVKGLALELDEIVLALRTRMRRLQVQSATAGQILIELGRYRRLERISPNNLLQMLRISLDLTQVVVNFNDQLRILERFGFIKLNMQIGEYALTEFGRQFMDGGVSAEQ
jgi:hypothetical protein